jgi:hypothetical protein
VLKRGSRSRSRPPQVNSSPDMGPTTPVTERLCRRCLYDTVRVMVSSPPRHPPPPPSVLIGHAASLSTG